MKRKGKLQTIVFLISNKYFAVSKGSVVLCRGKKYEVFRIKEVVLLGSEVNDIESSIRVEARAYELGDK